MMPGMTESAIPARTAHGPAYWAFVGWWLAPAKWLGRVLLWIVFFPVGAWRSIANHSRKKELRQRRGAKAARP